MMSWLLAATVQPGVVPRSHAVTDAVASRLALVQAECTFDGKQMAVRWCYHCRAYRPPRAVHCPTCGVCVMRWDHHCPWVSQCVGQRNYPFFLAYIWGTTVLSLYVGFFTVVYAFRIPLAAWKYDAFTDEVGSALSANLLNALLIVLVAIGVAVGLICVAPLTAFHSWLVVADQTTSQNDRTQYTRGSAQANCSAVLCTHGQEYEDLCTQCEDILDTELGSMRDAEPL